MRAKTLLHVRIYKSFEGMKANRHWCPIATQIPLGDPDVIHVSVDREFIKFSRRSTNKRYVFYSPPRVTNFVDSFDNGGPKTGFWLKLTTADLLSEQPRGQIRRRSKTTTKTTPKPKAGAMLAPAANAPPASVPTSRGTATATATATSSGKATPTPPPYRKPRRSSTWRPVVPPQ